MKKLILSVTFMLSAVVAVNAQEKKTAPSMNSTEIKSDDKNSKVNPKQELLEFTKILGLKDAPNNGLYELLEYKYQVLNDPNVSPEKRKDFMLSFEEKLKATLDPKSYEKLRSKVEFYSRLTDLNLEQKK